MTKTNWIALAVLAGIVSAAMHASVIALSVLSVFAFYLAPLPLFIAGLSLGWIPAAAGGAAGAAALVAMVSSESGLFFIAATALAPVVLSRLAVISRPRAPRTNEGEATEAGTEWYPEGRLLLWTAAMAGTLLTAVLLIIGPDADTIRATLQAVTRQIAKPMVETTPAEQRETLLRFVDVMATLAPLVSAAAWFATVVVNLFIAARLVSAQNISLRPWASFASLSFPRTSWVALLIACAASLMPGTAGLVATVFAAPLCVAFAILGLAVVHHLLARNPARLPLLVGLYLALIIINWIAMVPLIALALAELRFDVRSRSGPPPAISNRT